MIQSNRISKYFKCAVYNPGLSFSTVNKASKPKKKVPKNPDNLKYTRDRVSFKNQMHDLRQSWRKEYLDKIQRQKDLRSEERQRIIAMKAVKLREQKAKALEYQEIQRLRILEQRRRYEENLAKSLILHEKNNKLKQQRHSLLLNDLNQESSHWITSENIESKITPELFGRTAMTTGLVNPFSHLWKTQILTFALNRDISPELYGRLNPQTREDYLKMEADWKNEDKVMIENFLEGFVSTGEDRLMLKDVVENISKNTSQYRDEEVDELTVVRQMIRTNNLGYDIYPREGIDVDDRLSQMPVRKRDTSDDLPVDHVPGYVEEDISKFIQSEAAMDDFDSFDSEPTGQQPEKNKQQSGKQTKPMKKKK